jgi:hypothetical protein
MTCPLNVVSQRPALKQCATRWQWVMLLLCLVLFQALPVAGESFVLALGELARVPRPVLHATTQARAALKQCLRAGWFRRRRRRPTVCGFGRYASGSSCFGEWAEV